MSLEARIDELYRLPPAEFTAARNALAKTLAGADSKRVRALSKPTLVPWAVNQLYWRARAVYEKLMKSGAALRSAQIAALSRTDKSTPADLQRAAEVHRVALNEGVQQATRLAEADRLRPDPDDLSRTLESLSLAATRPEHPGRLTEAVRPAGFEALAGLPPAPQAVSAVRRTSEATRQPDQTDRRLAEARAERKRELELAAKRRRAETELKSAERDLERARFAEAKARDAYEQATRKRDAAQERLAAARKLALTSGF